MMKPLDHINAAFQVMRPAYTPSIAKVLLSIDVDNKFKAMIAEYKDTDTDDVMPDYDKLRPYHSLSLKREIFERHFGLMWFSTEVQFNHDPAAINLKAPICNMTLMVVTDEGLEPWFSRTGLAKLESNHSDGSYADAMTSAESRIYSALGLGDEGISELVFNETPKLIERVQTYINDNNVKLCELVKETNLAISKGNLTRSIIDKNDSHAFARDMHVEALRSVSAYIDVKQAFEEVENVA